MYEDYSSPLDKATEIHTLKDLKNRLNEDDINDWVLKMQSELQKSVPYRYEMGKYLRRSITGLDRIDPRNYINFFRMCTKPIAECAKSNPKIGAFILYIICMAVAYGIDPDSDYTSKKSRKKLKTMPEVLGDIFHAARLDSSTQIRIRRLINERDPSRHFFFNDLNLLIEASGKKKAVSRIDWSDMIMDLINFSPDPNCDPDMSEKCGREKWAAIIAASEEAK